MPYGNKLLPKEIYARIHTVVEIKIRKVAGKDATIEHIGGTSLKKPAGKGDIDIYVAYQSKQDLKRLEPLLTKALGKPGKITKDRIRYGLVVEGIDVEVQLISQQATNAAMALRDYLNSNPKEAKAYADYIAIMRKDYLAQMFEFKRGFTEKALKHFNNEN